MLTKTISIAHIPDLSRTFPSRDRSIRASSISSHGLNHPDPDMHNAPLLPLIAQRKCGNLMAIKFFRPRLANNPVCLSTIACIHRTPLRNMLEKILVVIAVLLALTITALAVLWHPQLPERNIPRPGLPPGGDFVLDTTAGRLALSDLRSKVVILTFGYTACPDICPTTLMTLADVIAQLEPSERKAAAFLFISVDPERDTPEHLAKYTAFFSPEIAGATGDPARLADIARRYGVIYSRLEGVGENYTVDHSADLYLIARDGRIADKIAYGTSSTAIATAIRKQLQSRP